MGARNNLAGQKFGRLTVVEFSGVCSRQNALWSCVCDCGKQVVVFGARLKSGNSKSCGCIRSEGNKTRYKKNDYEIVGTDTKVMIPDYKGNVFVCLVDTDRLEEVKKKRWFTKFCKSSGNYYVQAFEKENGVRKILFLHRILTNAPKGKVVDHINHNTLDNRKQNLRVCTPSENGQNRKGPSSRSTSGVRNVSWNPKRNKWVVNVTVERKRIHLGGYADLEEARTVAEAGRKKYLPFAT